VDVDAIGQLLILYSAFVTYMRNKLEYNEAVHQLFIDSRKLKIQLGGRSFIISSLSFVSP